MLVRGAECIGIQGGVSSVGTLVQLVAATAIGSRSPHLHMLD